MHVMTAESKKPGYRKKRFFAEYCGPEERLVGHHAKVWFVDRKTVSVTFLEAEEKKIVPADTLLPREHFKLEIDSLYGFGRNQYYALKLYRKDPMKIRTYVVAKRQPDGSFKGLVIDMCNQRAIKKFVEIRPEEIACKKSLGVMRVMQAVDYFMMRGEKLFGMKESAIINNRMIELLKTGMSLDEVKREIGLK